MTGTAAPAWLVLLLAASASLCLYLAAYAWQRRRMPGAREFTLFISAVAVYSVGYAVEISRTELSDILMAVRFEYLGIVLLGPSSLAFAVRLVRGKSLPRPLGILLGAFALLTLLVVWTSDRHSLFYLRPHVSTAGPFPAFEFEQGPWYLAHVAILELASFASAGILLSRALRADRRHRRQSIVLAVAGAIPLLTLLAYLGGIVPDHIDSGPFSLIGTGLLFAFALFRLGLLEIVPAARELAIDALRDGFIVLDHGGRLQDANPAARAMFGPDGFAEGEVLDPASLAGTSLGPLVARGEGSLDFSGSGEGEGEGEQRFRASAYPIAGSRGLRRGTALLVSDITETSRLMEKLKELADKDSLTGLLNRRHFIERASREIDLARRAGYQLGFIIADLDKFKRINDSLGHAAGDHALVTASRRFQAALRTVDIVSRYGGEEFAFLLPGTDRDSALATAERVRRALAEEPIAWEGELISLTGSFGVHTAGPRGTESLDECLRKADAALYAAKAAGRNRVVGSEDSATA